MLANVIHAEPLLGTAALDDIRKRKNERKREAAVTLHWRVSELLVYLNIFKHNEIVREEDTSCNR